LLRLLRVPAFVIDQAYNVVMATGKNILVWFRADLRVEDNPALFRAAADAEAGGGGVVGVFVISAGQWERHDWAGVRVEFVLRTLRELSAALEKLGVPLVVVSESLFSGVPKVIAEVASKHSCGAVYWNREYELNEARRDAAVEAKCAKSGVKTISFTDQVMVEPGEVRTGEGKYYTVFTPFRRALYKAIEERGGVKVVGAAKKQEAMGIASTVVPETVEGFVCGVKDAETLWPAGEVEARRRLKAFVAKRIAGYAASRNDPAVEGTSALSPYLAVGAISIRQCAAATVEANPGALGGEGGAAVWLSELAWRDFYRNILVGFPRVCMHRAFKPETERLQWSTNEEHFAAWCEGRTGVPIVDAGMRALAATGWMHNRVRMITAMYLVKDLFIDWRRGEAWFMRHLIDGDLASNNGGWQWSASTGTDAAPYFRIFNPVSQSRASDPSGAYIRKWVPELAGLEGGEKGAIHDPGEMPPLARAGIKYPDPVVDHSKARDRTIEAFKALK
jgi:deoxyribodipyrimidine photo-lyase